IPRPLQAAVDPQNYDLLFLAICLVALIVAAAAMEILLRSPFGRLLRCVREDDVVAASLGKNVLAARATAFAVGGAVIGAGAALHAFFLSYVDPTQFTPIMMAFVFMAVILGGRGSNFGLMIGACTVMTLLEATRFLKDLFVVLDGNQIASIRMILIGAALILL